MSSARATAEEIDALFAAIDRTCGPEDNGGDILDSVRDAVGRWDFDTYWELSSEEIQRAISGFS